MDHDLPPGQLGQLARRLVRVSAVTRVFGFLAIVVGAMFVLYGLSRFDRRVDDFVGFGSIGLGVACLGAVVWGVGAFHAAFARSLAVAVSVDERLGELVTIFRRLDQRAAQASAPAPVAAQAHAHAPEAPSNGHAAAPPPAAAAAPPPAAPAPPPKPVQRLCLKCGETLRPEVTRCRACMTKVLD